MDFDKQTECLIQYGFEGVAIELSSEKELSLEKLIKKYKENLSIGNNLTNLIVTCNDQIMESITQPVIAGNYYVIHIKHDKKG